MNVRAFLEDLRRQDIEVWAEGGQLRCKAPAGALVAELREELRQRKADIVVFLNAAKGLSLQQAAIVPLQPLGSRPPIFAVPGHNGDVFCFRALASHLGDDQPFFGLQPPGLDGKSEPMGSVEALAAYFAAQILSFSPAGAFVIAGYCAGGTVAFELARQLAEQGASIAYTALFGSPHPNWYRFTPQLRWKVAEHAKRLERHGLALIALSWSNRRDYIVLGWRRRQERLKADQSTRHIAADDPVLERRAAVGAATLSAVRKFKPRFFAGRVVVLLPNTEWLRSGHALLRWPGSTANRCEEYCGPETCDGASMLLEPHAPVFAAIVRKAGRAAEEAPVQLMKLDDLPLASAIRNL